MARPTRLRDPRRRTALALPGIDVPPAGAAPDAVPEEPPPDGPAALSGKPWLGYPVPDELQLPRGMIGPEERQMLYWLAAEYFRAEGTIVDAGSFAGASSFALASGLATSRHAGKPGAQVHCYDLFVARERYVSDAIASLFYVPAGEGCDYYRIFEYQTALYRRHIVPHRGDFLTAPVPDGPVEIVFIDVAKTADLNRRLVADYFPRLIPGRSVIVQRDYYKAWYPHIHITMEYLADHVTVVDPFVPLGSRVYLLTKTLPETLARDLDALGPEKEGALIRRAIEKDTGLPRMMLRVIEVLHLADTQGRRDAAREAAQALRRDSAFDPDSAYAADLGLIVESRQL